MFLKQIVDFCCGSNDFSCLMKEELQKMGKACEFKNYDLIQPKVIFFFAAVTTECMMIVGNSFQ